MIFHSCKQRREEKRARGLAGGGRSAREQRRRPDRPTHLEVEAQQIGDDPRDGRQDDDLGDVVEQRVHGQAVEPEGGVQFLRRRDRRQSVSQSVSGGAGGQRFAVGVP